MLRVKRGVGVGWIGFRRSERLGVLRGGDVEGDGRYPIHATRPIARPANTTIKKIDQPDMAAVAVSVLIERVGDRCSCEAWKCSMHSKVRDEVAI